MTGKNILLIIPELSMGGAQRSLAKLSIELSLKHNIALVVFQNKQKTTYPHGGGLINLNVETGDGLIQKVIAFIRRIRRLRKIKKEFGADIAISFLEGADYINILSSYREKVVLSIRGSKMHDENMASYFHGLRTQFLIPWLYRKADCIVAVNKGISREMVEDFGVDADRVISIGNFYDNEAIRKLSVLERPMHADLLYQGLIFITTGRLAREKGLLALVEVFAMLKRKFTRLKWVIVGDGPDGEKLIARFVSFGFHVQTEVQADREPDVLMVGAVENVYQYLRGATLYLMNSSSEGFPNGMVEAMICGVPVVSADCPYGPREILEPDFSYMGPVTEPRFGLNGVLMPTLDSQERVGVWCETLTRLIEEPQLRERIAASAKARVNQFGRDDIVHQWYQLINDLVGENSL